jgi:hypothetical protein
MRTCLLVLLLLGFAPSSAYAIAAAAGLTRKAIVPPSVQDTKRKKCSENRSEYRAKATEIFELEPSADLHSRKVREELVKKYCNDSRGIPINKGSGEEGLCEGTLLQSVDTIANADRILGEACLQMEKFSKLREGGTCDQRACLTEMRTAFVAARDKYAEAQKEVRKGVERLKPLVEANSKAQKAIGTHLVDIARIIKEWNQEQARLMYNSGQAGPAANFAMIEKTTQREILSDRLGPEFAKVEGSKDIQSVLSKHGVTVSDPAGIERRGNQIIEAASTPQSYESGRRFDQDFGLYAGEQARSVYFGQTVTTLGAAAERDLGNRVDSMNSNLVRIDKSIELAGSAPVTGGSEKGSSRPAEPAAQPAPLAAPTRLAGGSLSSTGASRAMAIGALGNSLNANQAAQAPGPQAMTVPRYVAATAAMPAGTGSFRRPAERGTPSGKTEAGVAKRSPTSNPADEDALPVKDLGLLEAEVPASAGGGVVNHVSRHANTTEAAPFTDAPAKTQSARSPASTGVKPPVPDFAPKLSEVAYAKEDPAISARIERDIGRMETGSGRKFSSSLRERLREQLKGKYSSRQLGGEGSEKGTGSGGAVAGLIQEMHDNGTLPDQRADRLALAGAETDAEVRRLINGLSPEEDASFGILDSHSRSLFERVRSAYQRHLSTAVAGH